MGSGQGREQREGRDAVQLCLGQPGDILPAEHISTGPAVSARSGATNPSYLALLLALPFFLFESDYGFAM